MADILTSVFRTFMSQTDVNKDVTVSPHSACSALLPGDSSVIRSVLLPGDSSVSSSVLLLGDSSISRSLLLLSAVMAASELGMRVVFFTQTQIQSLPVSLQKCVPSPESLKKIKFSYPRTLGDLLQQVAGLHESQNTSPTPPSLIIVDRLEGFLGGNHSEDQSSAAHLYEAAAGLKELWNVYLSATGITELRTPVPKRERTDRLQPLKSGSCQSPLM
ncbi:hypothetical protein F7725_003880, partial [Dissostichus mawsoni]